LVTGSSTGCPRGCRGAARETGANRSSASDEMPERRRVLGGGVILSLDLGFSVGLLKSERFCLWLTTFDYVSAPYIVVRVQRTPLVSPIEFIYITL
jgi:hypothetical protein